jgi:hypothetical protein
MERSTVSLAEARKARELKGQGNGQVTDVSTTTKTDTSVTKTPLSRSIAALAARPKPEFAERDPETGHLNTLLLLSESQTHRRLDAGAPSVGRPSLQQQVLGAGRAGQDRAADGSRAAQS